MKLFSDSSKIAYSKAFVLIAIIYLIFDVSFSFYQHYQMPLESDMAKVILPSKNYQAVMKNPFGLRSFTKDTCYAATNRFFAHWVMASFFRTVPIQLQSFLSPINSIYITTSLAKIIIQYLLVIVLVLYIVGFKAKVFDYMLAALLITPLFQTFGFNGLMGIIDPSITYTFFYALSSAIVLLFFLPYFNGYYHNAVFRFNAVAWGAVLTLLLVLSFNGPLNPAIVLIICPLALITNYLSHLRRLKLEGEQNRVFIKAFLSIPPNVSVIFVLAILLSLYSFILGTRNVENNSVSTLQLLDRYSRLPMGLYLNLTQKLGPSMLLLVVLINSILIKKLLADKRALGILKWIGIFSLIFLILLPLGGYREYRPNIVRRDTIMPIYLLLFLYFGLSSFILIKELGSKSKYLYYGFLAIFWTAMFNADLEVKNRNYCERMALQELSDSPETIVELSGNCFIMGWLKMEDYKDSKTNTQLLEYWGVISEEKYYYQK